MYFVNADSGFFFFLEERKIKVLKREGNRIEGESNGKRFVAVRVSPYSALWRHFGLSVFFFVFGLFWGKIGLLSFLILTAAAVAARTTKLRELALIIGWGATALVIRYLLHADYSAMVAPTLFALAYAHLLPALKLLNANIYRIVEVDGKKVDGLYYIIESEEV